MARDAPHAHRTELARSAAREKRAAQREGLGAEPFWRTPPKVREGQQLGKTLASSFRISALRFAKGNSPCDIPTARCPDVRASEASSRPRPFSF